MDSGEGLLWRGRSGRMDAASLRRIELFREMAEPSLARLAEQASWRRWRRGESILDPLEVPGEVFILLEGRVIIGGRAPDGKAVDVFFLGPGDVIDFNDLPPILGAYVYVEAGSEEVISCRLPRPAFHGAVFGHPASAALLDRQARQRLLELALLLWEFAFHDALHRLEHVLAQVAEGDPEHVVPLTREELGRRTGIRREDVTKFLKRLKAQGLVDYGSHHRGIKVLDLARLAADQPDR